MTPQEKLRKLNEIGARIDERKERVIGYLEEMTRMAHRLEVLSGMRDQLLAEIAADERLINEL